jgi:hypothetical protein
VALFACERIELHVDETVLVNGEDGIPERRATVMGIDRGKVKLRFIDHRQGDRLRPSKERFVIVHRRNGRSSCSAPTGPANGARPVDLRGARHQRHPVLGLEPSGFATAPAGTSGHAPPSHSIVKVGHLESVRESYILNDE